MTKTAHQLVVERRKIPSVNTQDENYRRLRYVRYADDFLLGFTGSKADAEEIKEEIGRFLKREIKSDNVRRKDSNNKCRQSGGKVSWI